MDYGLRTTNGGLQMIAALLVLLLAPAAPAAQTQLTPEQAIARRQLSDVRISPDGERVCFVVSEPPKGTTRSRHIWMLNGRSRELRQFTNSSKSEYSPRWSSDGKKLAFLSDREDRPQIYLISGDGGEAARLTEGKNGVRSFVWSPDAKQLAFLASEPKTDAEEKKEKDKDDARVVDRDDKHARLWLLDIESKKIRQLTSGPWEISEAQWAPKGDRLVVSATDHAESDQYTHRIFSIVVADGQMKEIASPRGQFGAVRLSPDGKNLTYLAARVDGPTPHDLYLQSIEGGVPKNLTGSSLDRPISSAVWLRDGRMLAVAQTGCDSGFYVVDTNGKVQLAASPEVHPTSAFDSTGDLVAFVGESATQAPELWLGHFGGSSTLEKVTHFNEAWNQIPLIKPEVVRYKSFDGTEIEALLLKPHGYVEGTKVPTVVMVHGGPTGVWSDSFEPWGQLLAARGYAVFYPNIRGSTGYGHRFLEMNRGDWGGGDFKDVMAGVDFLINRGIADANRLGIGGWSYGGYMAAWAITQTQRFKAAVSGAGMSDLATEFGTEDGPAYDEWFYGLPYEKSEGFAKSSPMTYVKNARTPTLLLHGENDRTDPIAQSEMLYRALKRYGVESEFVAYPREPHGLQEEKHLIDRLNRIVRWFDSHLK
jgi:dipeptidyl aminopeptidase/acylaminoacyl peptidase